MVHTLGLLSSRNPRDPLQKGSHPPANQKIQHTIRPEMITQIIRKQFFCVTDVCNWKINSQRILLCNWHLQKVPHGGALITQNDSCQRALCNRCPVQLEINPHIKNVCKRTLFGALWKTSRIFREISCGNFPWKLKDKNLQTFSPNFRRSFRPSLAQISPELRSGRLLA